MSERFRISTRAIMTELNCERIYQSMVRDVSSNGMSIIIKGNPQALDKEVLVDFVNPRTGNLIQIRGTIIRAKSTSTSTRLNIQFVQISRYNRSNLDNLLFVLQSSQMNEHFVSL